jgi:hypothetical protein
VRQPRVYVTQQPVPDTRGWQPNLTPASEFGSIHYVFFGDAVPTVAPNQSLEIARFQLRDFNCDLDYVLWPHTGDPAAMWATMIVLCRKLNVRKIAFLVWQRKLRNGHRDRQEGFYTPIVFTMPNGLFGE